MNLSSYVHILLGRSTELGDQAVPQEFSPVSLACLDVYYGSILFFILASNLLFS